MRYLRQSTTVTVQVGPFLDSTDGVTTETGLAGSMTVQVSKAGAAFGARSSATAITHDADGFYRVELNTTDTSAAGPLMLKSLVSGACPVWHEFTVMAQARYDLAIEGTGVQPVNVTQWNSAAVATPATAGYPVVTNKVGTGTGELSLTAGVIAATVNSFSSGAKTEINTEVLDVLTVDTFGEPTGVPAASATIAGKIGRVYQALRNKLTVDGTAKTCFDDSGAALWKKPVSDAAGTYTEDEGTTP